MALDITDLSLRGILYGLSQHASSKLPLNTLYQDLISIMSHAVNESKPELLEAYIEETPLLDPIADLLFDLLAIEWLFGKSEEDEYPEIFETYGSELLSVLMYLNDCYDNEIQPNIGDFLDMVSEGEMFGESEDTDHYMSLFQWQEAIKEGPEAFRLQLSDTESDEEMLAIAWFFTGVDEDTDTVDTAQGSVFTSAFYHALSSFYRAGTNFPPNFTELLTSNSST